MWNRLMRKYRLDEKNLCWKFLFLFHVLLLIRYYLIAGTLNTRAFSGCFGFFVWVFSAFLSYFFCLEGSTFQCGQPSFLLYSYTIRYASKKKKVKWQVPSRYISLFPLKPSCQPNFYCKVASVIYRKQKKHF